MEESRTNLLRKLRNPGELEKLVDRLFILSQIYQDERATADGPARSGEYLLDKVLLDDELACRLVQIDDADPALTERDRSFLRSVNIKPW